MVAPATWLIRDDELELFDNHLEESVLQTAEELINTTKPHLGRRLRLSDAEYES
jgi:hypothetical protein